MPLLQRATAPPALAPGTKCSNGGGPRPPRLPRRDADQCENWAALLLLPNPKTMKSFFQALVITTWVVLGITA